MIWWVIIAILMVFGFLGCFINKVPGPIAVVLAVLVAKFGIGIDIDWGTIIVLAFLAILSMVASKLLVTGMKKLQEYSKKASIGTTIGSILGLLFLSAIYQDMSTGMLIFMFVIALVIIPFVLAFLMELSNKQGTEQALKCAASATAAYLVDSFLKLVVFFYAIYQLFS